MPICEWVYFVLQWLIDTFCTRTKAVADGALMFTLDHSVSSRMAKYTYGIESCTPYNPQRADHRAREHASFRARSGELMMPKSFMAILEKVRFTPLSSTSLLISKSIGYRSIRRKRVQSVLLQRIYQIPVSRTRNRDRPNQMLPKPQ